MDSFLLFNFIFLLIELEYRLELMELVVVPQTRTCRVVFVGLIRSLIIEIMMIA